MEKDKGRKTHRITILEGVTKKRIFRVRKKPVKRAKDYHKKFLRHHN